MKNNCMARRPRRTVKIVSLILSIAMLLSLFAGLDFSAHALASSGSCGTNVTYTFNSSTGKLTISGTGSMTNYSSYASCPFYNQSSIKSVVINNGVTSIGRYAFYGCSGLTSVTIGNSVTSIGSYAFEDCTSLKSIAIPNSITSIGSSAFSKCSALTKVNINSLEKWCSISFSDRFSNPLYYARNLYLNNELITELEIPNSVTSIGRDAFYGCTGLTSIEIPNSVTSIGGDAFYGCTGLTSVTIGNSVTSIGGYAFAGCSGLTSIEIPSSVTSIGNYAFRNCSGLTSIIVDSGNTVYDSRNNCNAIIKTASNALIAGCKNTIIPNSVTSIGDSAFCACSGLIRLGIPNSVINIGNTAFAGCSGLSEVYYTGSMAEWNGISIGSNNDPLKKARIHYNSILPCEIHTPSNAVIENEVAATCTGKGSHDEVVYCSICLTELSRETVSTEEALGHDFVSASKEPTCTENGFNGYSCSRCGEIIAFEEYPALGHIYEIIDSKDATCTATGYIKYRCTRCNNEYTETLAALGHNYSSARTAPTCTEKGYTTYTCTRCGYSYKSNYTSAVHMSFDETTENEVSPTCTKEGSYDEVVYCHICGAEVLRETHTINALGHNYSSIITAPTCTEQGYTTYTCTRCDYSYIGDYVEANGHSSSEAVIENEVAPTCTENGSYDEVVYCSVCEAELSRDAKTVNALGHNYAVIDSLAATCTEAGYNVYECTRCKDSYTETLKALSHSFFADSKAASCTEAGYTGYKCKNCGQLIVQKSIPALGHSYAIQQFENGVAEFRCSRCEDEFSDSFADHINDKDCDYFDMNGDGIVNAKDYAYLLKNF